MKNNYVLKHNFGYGSEREKPVNKLSLRNFEDCKVYVEEILKTFFDGVYENNVLSFADNTKVEICLTKE